MLGCLPYHTEGGGANEAGGLYIYYITLTNLIGFDYHSGFARTYNLSTFVDNSRDI